VLVNNAGLFQAEEFLEVTADQYAQLADVNVKGVLRHSARGPADDRNGGGRIINVSSIAGFVGNGSYVAYCVSKGQSDC